MLICSQVFKKFSLGSVMWHNILNDMWGGGVHLCIKTEVNRHYFNFKVLILKFIKRNVGKNYLCFYKICSEVG